MEAFSDDDAYLCSRASQLPMVELKEVKTDEIRAQKTCLKVSVAEGILLFVREYFSLHSFGEAENLPLSDYLIAKKDNYNKVMAQREYAKIQNEKIKSK